MILHSLVTLLQGWVGHGGLHDQLPVEAHHLLLPGETVVVGMVVAEEAGGGGRERERPDQTRWRDKQRRGGDWMVRERG